MHPLLQLLAPAITMALLDAAWFATIGSRLLASVHPLLRTPPDWYAGTAVYIALSVGLFLFVRPMIAQGSWTDAMLWGGAFGGITYAIYELTNKALLSGWTWQVVTVDTVWGMLACAAGAMVLRWTLP